jgi:hypothetical protein
LENGGTKTLGRLSGSNRPCGGKRRARQAADRDPEGQADAGLRTRWCQAREGRAGGNQAPGRWSNALEGKNPKGASSRRPFNSRRRPGTFGRAKAWKSRPVVPVCRTCPAGDLGWLTACGFSGRGNPAATFRKGNASKGRIPGALSGRNKPDQAMRGVNRQEGDQTLKAERSGSGKPAGCGPESLARAEGK